LSSDTDKSAKIGAAAILSKEIVHAKNALEPIRPYYSQGTVAKKGNLVFAAGQTWDPKSGKPGKGDVVAQTRETLESMKAVLEAAGSSMDNVLKVTVYLRNMEDLDKIKDVRMQYFGKSPPASTLVEVNKLWHEDVLVEIDAIAVTK
jgi:2-iminobutanoate/2-iminopropanoate deaminase